MTTVILRIKDEVNCKLVGLDLHTRKKLVNKFKYFIPYARHTPAFKLGRWDGSVSFFQMGGSTFINLLPDIIPILLSEKYEIEIEDLRTYRTEFDFELVKKDSYAHIKWPKGHTIEGEPIILRDHQVESINLALQNPQSMQEIATAAGKTIITSIMSHKCEPYGRTIIIVPSTQLVTQTEEDYINMGLDVGVFYGGRKEIGKTHTICTWQSLGSMHKKSKDGSAPIDINDFLEGVVAVIVDEAHGIKAEVLKTMLTTVMGSIPIRWGLTGTIPKEDFQKAALRVSIGDVVGKVSAKSLQDKGILAKCHVKVLQLMDWKDFGNYQSEMKYLTGDEKRLDWLAKQFDKIAIGSNTLILVNYISTGKLLAAKMDNAVFISGATKIVDRKDQYDEVKDANDKIIIATYGVAAIGINVPRIFNLVLFESGKSFIRVIQSIGRGVRIARDKDFAQVWDITSNCKYAKRHLRERKRFYKDAEYPFSIKKINWQDE